MWRFKLPGLSNNTINDDLSSLFDVHGMVQHVSSRTQCDPSTDRDNILDLIVSKGTARFMSNVQVVTLLTTCLIMNSTSAPSRSSGPRHRRPIINIVTSRTSTFPSSRHVCENPWFSQPRRKLPIYLLIK